MKKQIVLGLGLAVIAAPALASKARLQALGEDVNGSFYVNDNRNVFLNAAQVNNHKDLVTFEWGDTTQLVDGTTTPRAEGGFFKSHGNLVYGVQLGSESNTSNGFRAASVGLADAASVDEENNIDLFVGGDAGVKWGANLTYSKSGDDETNGDANQQALRSRFGVIAGDIEGWANININNKAEDAAGDEFEGKLGYKVGGVYHMNDYNIFADYQSFSGEANGTNDGDLKATQLQVGAGKTNKLNDKATLFTKVQLQMNEGENDFGGNFGTGLGACAGLATSVACEEYKSTFVPVVIGLEYDAASWLVLRGSVAQTIWGNEEDKDNKRPLQNTTAINAGATLKFGEMSVDGVIGNANGATTDGDLNTDNLMSRVSMTYRF